MKISKQLRRSINRIVRSYTSNGYARVGFRKSSSGSEIVNNALLWNDDNDLDDTVMFRDVTEIDDDTQQPGWALLDLYAWNNTPFNQDLETNVYVVVRQDERGAQWVAYHTNVGGERDLDAALAERKLVTRGW